MITRFTIAFEVLLASSIAPQVMPPCSCIALQCYLITRTTKFAYFLFLCRCNNHNRFFQSENLVYSRHQARSVFDHWYNKEHITFHGAFSCFFHVCVIVPHVPDKKEMEMQGIAIELHIGCNCINICQNIQFIYYIN